MIEMGGGDQDTTMIRPPKMNIPNPSIPMLSVEEQLHQIHYGCMQETMIKIMDTERYIVDP